MLDRDLEDLVELGREVEADGWLADERWAQTRTLREVVRIYRAVLAQELRRLDELLVTMHASAIDVLRATPEPGSPVDRVQESLLHALTAVLDGMPLLADARVLIVEPAQVQTIVGLEDYDVTDYAAGVGLPFSTLYLDFAADDYRLPHRIFRETAPAFGGWTALLHGAFVARQDDCWP